MRILFVAGAVVLALSVPHVASAAPITFGYTGMIVNFTVPTIGQYVIAAIGARGGSVFDGGGTGGLGVEAAGLFSLAGGEQLRILIGASGADNTIISAGFESFAGGGGGTFVVGSGGLPLLAAGGGGGGGQLNASYPPAFQTVRGGASYNGGDGLIGPDGGTSLVAGDVSGSANGGSGGTGASDGQGGSFGPGRSRVNDGHGFNSFPVGLGMGAFGGGGLADDLAGGGGGGGYSGGGGGGLAANIGTFKYGVGGGGGGGGGSFDTGYEPFIIARAGTGDGSVSITALAAAVPEPTSVALLCSGLLGLCLAARWRKDA